MRGQKAPARILAAAALFVPFGCITINVHFPAKELSEAAEKIVDEVRPEVATDSGVEKERPVGTLPRARNSTLRRAGSTTASFVSFPLALVAAQDKDDKDDDVGDDIKIDVATPRIKAIQKTLKARYLKLLPFYQKGALGEGNNGLLALRDVEGLDRKEGRDVRLLLKDENKDRLELYTEIAQQNSIDKKMVPKIGQLFSVEWQKKSKTGWWIQDKKGKWEKKKPPKKKGPAEESKR